MAKSILLLALLVVFALECHCQNDDEDWWKHIQLYQIYPRSFKDALFNDGIGDIPGIKMKLEHLRDIGVTATWISPIFVSPMKDSGYDIENFYKIGEEYGTNEDLEALMAEAKRLGIRILLDFVPNHTSDKCQWFIDSENKVPGWEDFYVWHKGRPNTTHPDERPSRPSNWVQVFRGPAWTWSDIRQEYYLHQFLPEQPDLNFRNPLVIEEMKKVLRFWLDKGASGFRVDAISHLVEVDVGPDGHYPDEPVAPWANIDDDPYDYGYLEHIHTRERDETYDVVFGWRAAMDDYVREKGTETKVLFMEAGGDMDIIMRYYGNDTVAGAHFPFNFELVHLNKDANAREITNRIKNWFDNIPEGKVTNWVIGNHDQRRATSRFGPDRIDGVMIMVMLLPGVVVTYQGEEIQMTDQPLSWEDTVDPQGCNAGVDRFNITSRDPARTPFHWDATLNAGFSDKPTDCCWLPVADNYRNLNLEQQKNADWSPYKLYKKLAELRTWEAIKNGDFVIELMNDDLLVFIRSHGNEKVVVVVNTSDRRMDINLTWKFEQLRDKTFVLELASSKSISKIGNIYEASSLMVDPYEALVLKSGAALMTSSLIMMWVFILFVVIF